MLNLYLGSGSSPTGTLLFRGEVGDVRLDRKIYSAPFGGNKQRKIPRVVMQRRDNHSLYSPEGGFAFESYAKTGTLIAVGASPPSIEVDIDGSFTLGEFRRGWLKVGSGATYETRMILGEGTAAGGADIWATIDRPLIHAQAGDAATLYTF